jgi:hypothetical protein
MCDFHARFQQLLTFQLLLIFWFQAPIDFNQYLGIQRAGIACLKLPQQRVREYAAVWRQRAAALVPVLRQFGWQLPEPKACKYQASPLQPSGNISMFGCWGDVACPVPINRVVSLRHHSIGLANLPYFVTVGWCKRRYLAVLSKAWVPSLRA